MTRKEMVDQLVRGLGLQDILSLDETTFIDPQLHWGTIDLLARTKCVVRCQHLQVSAGVETYLLPHSVLALVDLEDGALPKARRDQASLAPSFTLIRADVLRIEPVPTANTEVDVWGVPRPIQMSDDTHSPGDELYGAIPDEYQDAILTYAFWKLSDYTDDSGSGQGERYRIAYEGQDGRTGRIGQIKSLVNRRGTGRLPARKVRMQGPSYSRSAWVG